MVYRILWKLLRVSVESIEQFSSFFFSSLTIKGNIRMFYPTCYVYKIAPIDESNSSNETTTTANKKSDIPSTKKSKIPTSTNLQSSTTINTPLDLITNNNKNENILIKNLSDQLLISAQRNNCIDIEKK